MIGVLVMAYGGPNSLEEVEPYLLEVRGGRPTSPELVAEVRRRYELIGGRSPILAQTTAQAESLGKALNAAPPELQGFRTYVGMRHWHPYIEDSLNSMAAHGIDRAVGIVMAPHYSRLSVGAYVDKAAGAAVAIELAFVEQWHLLPGYLTAVVRSVRDVIERLSVATGEVDVIFTAHSLPQSILATGDPYPKQLAETAEALAGKLGEVSCHFAYQSAAMTSDPWLGPDAGDVIRELAARRRRNIIVAPIGFTTEHVEILYDIDIEYRELAQRLGVTMERTEMAGNDAGMMRDLATLVVAAAREREWL